MRRVLSLVLVFALMAAGIWWAVTPSVAAKPPSHYTLRPVARGDIDDVVTAVGSLQPSQYVDVGAQVSGQLDVIHVAVGDRVEKGQLLAEIDDTLYQAKVTADRALLEAIQAQLTLKDAGRRNLQRQVARQKDMLQARATSQEAYDAAATALEQIDAEMVALRAQAKQTTANLGADEAGLRYTRIYAPMAGTVVSLTARQGQTLNAAQTAPIILRIADLDTMTVWTQVSEADIPRLAVGMDAYFTTLGRPNRRWTGKLRQIMPTPDVVNSVVLYNALFDVDNRDNALLPHMSAQVFFLVSRARNVLTVPAAALRDGDGSSATVDVLQDGRRVPRRVEVGISDRVNVEIKSGLSSGEQVIIPEPGGGPADSGPAFRFKWPKL
jgi:macrolide-specific efflux system membrane fusion protein